MKANMTVNKQIEVVEIFEGQLYIAKTDKVSTGKITIDGKNYKIVGASFVGGEIYIKVETVPPTGLVHRKYKMDSVLLDDIKESLTENVIANLLSLAESIEYLGEKDDGTEYEDIYDRLQYELGVTEEQMKEFFNL